VDPTIRTSENKEAQEIDEEWKKEVADTEGDTGGLKEGVIDEIEKEDEEGD
jgi:hypothetical protein